MSSRLATIALTPAERAHLLADGTMVVMPPPRHGDAGPEVQAPLHKRKMNAAPAKLVRMPLP